MTDDGRFSSPHLGGPLGLAGLITMTAAAAALVFIGANSDLESAEAASAPSGPLMAAASYTEPPEDGGGGAASGTRSQSVDFIVRFNGVEEIDEVLGEFRSDPDAARAAFKAWAADKPPLQGLTLKDVTYSGECILTYTPDNDRRPVRAIAAEVRQRLEAAPGVRYADPDYTAHPGGIPE
ncbi:MAG: hypothetical protein AAFX03_11665 [Pseudomonadota bacterium]